MKTVKLDNPITVDGTPVSELTFRPVKVRDCLAMERGGSSDFEKEDTVSPVNKKIIKIESKLPSCIVKSKSASNCVAV